MKVYRTKEITLPTCYGEFQQVEADHWARFFSKKPTPCGGSAHNCPLLRSGLINHTIVDQVLGETIAYSLGAGPTSCPVETKFPSDVIRVAIL